MKLQLILTALMIAVMPCMAEFRIWTNADGKEAELNLRSVQEVNGEKVGLFGMKSGRTDRLKSSQLSPEDAKAMEAWKPRGPDVFAEALKDDLVILKDGRFENHDHDTPEKYYMFYYTASWCGPCVAFTPTLVKWPHLKMSKVKQFKSKFKHPGSGIPNLVLCDLQGKIIKSSYDKGSYIGPYEVMRHLDGLLSK